MKSVNYNLIELLLVICSGFTIVTSQSDKQTISIWNPSSKELINLFKCKCTANQVLVEDNCRNNDTEVTVFNEKSKQRVSMATNEFGNVSVRDIECSNGSVPHVIESSLFLEDGSLYDSENDQRFNPKDFCFEHNYQGNDIIVNSKICQSIPSVPQCCNKGYILNSNSKCSYEEGFSFSPPFANGKTWENISGEVSMMKECPQGNDFQVVNISAPQSSMSLILSEKNEVILHKKPSQFEIALNFSSEFCVAARKHNYGFYYQANFCKKNNTFHHEQMCKDSSCSRKCCPVNNVFSMINMACVISIYGQPSIPIIMIRNGFYSTEPKDNATKKRIITGPPLCTSFLKVEKDAEDTLTIDDNGLLQVRTLLAEFTPRSYCIENLVHKNWTEETAFVCSESLSDYDCEWSYILMSILLAVSSLFLLLTFVVYFSLKELRGRTSGKCLISEVASLFVAYIVLIILHTRSHRLSTGNCQVTGTIEYIFSLASFFWLNVMCYDMWTTIRSHRPVDDEHRGKTRIILYSVYGWGLPLLMGFVALIMDSLPHTPENKHLIRPGFGIKSCYFADNKSKWAYLYDIILVLLCVNFGFFIHIVIILMKAQKDNKKMFTDQNRNPGGNKDASKERCWMYVKLFVVMGISWLSEVISAETEVWYPNLCYAWLVTDAINALRGVLIFIIFVCKKTTMKKIYTKWYGDFAKRKRSSFLKWSSQEGETVTRSSNVSSGSFPSIRRKETLSSSYKKNLVDSFSMSEIPEQQEKEPKEDDHEAGGHTNHPYQQKQ
ncbi:UNVERIFIED_CONTAM: hypothetical protein RMT77_008053 [Armadillidium vulgare]